MMLTPTNRKMRPALVWGSSKMMMIYLSLLSISGMSAGHLSGVLPDNWEATKSVTYISEVNDKIIDSEDFLYAATGSSISGDMINMTDDAGPYCTPTYFLPCSTGDYINSYSFGGMSSTSSGCSAQANNYSLNSTIPSNVLQLGGTYPINVGVGTSPNYIGVWIDYNNDFDFDDAEEFVFNGFAPAGSILSGNITIPNNSGFLGVHRVRVRSNGSAILSNQSCELLAIGETEDYYVNLSNTYCSGLFSSSCVAVNAAYINIVSFGGIDNIGSGCSGQPNNYSVNYSVPTQLLSFGSSYPIVLGSISSLNTNMGVWIDYNNDFDFDDAGEFVFSGLAIGNQVLLGNITIPNNAAFEGPRRLRVRSSFTNNIPLTSGNSCTNLVYGETEDYYVNISNPGFNQGSITQGNQTFCNGGDPVNIVATTATAAGHTYQWYYQNGIISAPLPGELNFFWTPIGVTTPSYDPPAGLTESRTYARRTTFGSLSDWTSGVRQITVFQVFNYGTIASGNQTFSNSGDPAAISLSTVASGGAGTFTYQWYSSAGIQPAPTGTAIPAGWTAIAGATSNSYNPGVVSSSISYALQVNPTGTPDCAGATWASGVRQITVNPSVFNPGVVASANQTICNAGDPSNIVFSTAATAGSTFQWYFQAGIIAAPAATAAVTGWTLIAAATSSSYDPPTGLTASRTYACRVNPTSNNQWASGVRQVTVLPVFNAGAVTVGDETFCTSGDPANITLSVNPAGSGAYQWRWYFREAATGACPSGSTVPVGWNTNASTIISGTSLTGSGISFDPSSAGAVGAGRTFAVLITPIANGSIPACGVPAWSNSCRKTVVNSCTGFTPGVLAAGNQTLCNPGDPANITVATAATAGSTYQWYFQNGIIVAPLATAATTGWTLITAATAATYDAPSGLTVSRTYARRVINGANNQWSSGVRQITVFAMVNFGTIALGNQTFSGSGDPSAIAFSTAPTGGAGTFTYQWYSIAGIQVAPTGTVVPAGWSAITGATAVSYNPTVQSASISYAVQVNPTGLPDCAIATWASGVRQITVNATGFTPGVLAAGNATLCNPANPANITIATAATTGSTFQWYFQNGIIAAPLATAAITGWTSIAAATLATYDAPAGLTVSRTYARRVINGANNQWSSGVVQITVLPVFNPGTILAGDQTFCNTGNPANITLSTNPLGSGAYQWRWYFRETATGLCPSGATIGTEWLTNTTSTNITGTTVTGAGISFDPIGAGAVGAGRTFAVLITPLANGSIPACGTAQWAASCRKTTVNSCRLGEDGQEIIEQALESEAPFLGQSFPNPTLGSFKVPYFLPESYVSGRIILYDITGKQLEIVKCVSGENQTVEFNISYLANGTYYYTLESGNLKIGTGKLILIK